MLFIRQDVLEIWGNLALPAHPGQPHALSSLDHPALVTWLRFTRPVIHWTGAGAGGSISTSCALTFPLEGEQKRQFTPVPISWAQGPPGSPMVWAEVMCLFSQGDWMASITAASTCRYLWNPRIFPGLVQHPLLWTVLYTPSSSSQWTQMGQIMCPRLYSASYILFLSLIPQPPSVLLVIPQSWLQSPPVDYSSCPPAHFTFEALGDSYQLQPTL